MSTADLAGPASQLQPEVEPNWRGTCARASVALAALGLLAAAVVVVLNLTFWLDGLPGSGTSETVAVLTALIAPVAGLVTGFLGRRSPRRRTAVLGSVLSVLAIVGFGMPAIQMPHDPSMSGLAWSPDSTRIAYAHTRGNYVDDGIWVDSADGSTEPTQLVATGSAPAWSPDGTTICYVTGSFRLGGDLWLMDADGRNSRKVRTADAHDGIWGGCSWSPDGTQIVFGGAPKGDDSGGIWIIDADGTDLRQVVGWGDAPDWSPDGARIAYRAQPDPAGDHAEGYWVINVDGTGRTALPGQNYGAPQWTADGRIVVDCNEGTCITDADGSNRAVLLPGTAGAVPSPDGTRVARVTGTGIKTDIIVTTRDQTTQTALIP
jgi:WD40 repeat protein